jgi:FdhD protein
LCGNQALDDLVERLAPFDTSTLPQFAVDMVLAMPEAVRSEQALFDETGAVHAAAAIDVDGRIELVREDVGRHNAVDKVVGRLLLDERLPAHDHALFVSGRASFEMVQKAWAAGFGTVVSVSAPTALAVQTAKRAGITLYGFVRDGQAVRYSPG